MMLDTITESEDDEDKELSEDSKFIKARKKSKKKKIQDRLDDTDGEDESSEEGPLEEDDEDDREASFFSKSRKTAKKSSEAEAEQDRVNQLPDSSELESQENKKNIPKSLTEAEAQEAVSAIADGLSRELRNEFDQCAESTVAELEVVAVATFVDSLREKVENGNEEISEELLDEALLEALEDLLGVGESAFEIVGQDESEDAGGNIYSDTDTSGGNDDGGNQSLSKLYNSGNPSSPVTAVIAANADTYDNLADSENRRGKGLLIGGVVGYIIGRRHGQKRAEAKFQPEVDKLEDQIAELYDALASRELMIRQVVRELAARQLGKHETAKLDALSAEKLDRSSAENLESSKAIEPPSLIIPATFATLLVSSRLMADVSNERNTWGKDFLIGGVAGYMIGRRHGRKRTETRLKSEMEQLEDQIYSLQDDLINRDFVIDAAIQATAVADHKLDLRNIPELSDPLSKRRTLVSSLTESTDSPLSENATSTTLIAEPEEPEVLRKSSIVSEQVDSSVSIGVNLRGGRTASINSSGAGDKVADQTRNLEKQLVEASMDRIAVSRKNREVKRHKEHLLKSGRAEAIGVFNLSTSVLLERRLMDGTENSSERKQIEVMNEDELLAMSKNIYVDGESAIDLYDRGRVKLEVLRESVIQFWRKTGDYEHTLRTNLAIDESAINDIRTNLEKAYRSILESA